MEAWTVILLLCLGVAFLLIWGGNGKRTERRWARVWFLGALACAALAANRVPFPTDATANAGAITLGAIGWAAPFLVVAFLIFLIVNAVAGKRGS